MPMHPDTAARLLAAARASGWRVRSAGRPRCTLTRRACRSGARCCRGPLGNCRHGPASHPSPSGRLPARRAPGAETHSDLETCPPTRRGAPAASRPHRRHSRARISDTRSRGLAGRATGRGRAPRLCPKRQAPRRCRPPPDLVKSERPTAFKVLFSANVSRCEAAGEAPKSKRALGLALGGEQFVRSNLKGGEVHYGVQMRKRLAVVAA